MKDGLYLFGNVLSQPLPTELGGFVNLEIDLSLQQNSMTSSVPTELGQLVSLTSGLRLKANQFCDDLPTEVQALSSQVTDAWLVTTDTSIGKTCTKNNKKGVETVKIAVIVAVVFFALLALMVVCLCSHHWFKGHLIKFASQRNLFTSNRDVSEPPSPKGEAGPEVAKLVPVPRNSNSSRVELVEAEVEESHV